MRCPCVEAVDVDSLAQDDAAAQEADARHHLGGNPRRVSVAARPENTTKPPAPSATRALVRTPASFWLNCRSNPMTDPSSSARPR